MKKTILGLLRIIRPTLTRRFLYGYIYNIVCRVVGIKEHYVLLESHHGKDFSGNPYYLAAFLASRQQYEHLCLVVVAPLARESWIMRRFGVLKIIVVRPRSLRYVYYLATSKWLISDVTFPLYFSRRSGQRYLNTWHGTPLKTLGRHAEVDAARHLVNIQRNFLHASKIISPNQHAENVFLDSYFLQSLFVGDFLRVGYPRNDPLFNLKERKTKVEEGRSLAFMPTWRGGLSERKVDSQQQLRELTELLDRLDEFLPDAVILWVKLHPLVSGQIVLNNYRRIKPFPADLETYEHLASCDALITDYSSVFFDYAATRRPIIRYVPDEEDYVAERGFCLDPTKLPFPVARTADELVVLVQRTMELHDAGPSDEYSEFLALYNELDHGTSAQDVCRAFFVDDDRSELNACGVQAERKRVALYVGGAEGELSSYIRFLERLDMRRYDFILLIEADAVTPEWESLLKKFGSLLAYVPIQFHAYITPLEFVRLLLICHGGSSGGAVSRTWREVGAREYKRLFGEVVFDDFINLDETSVGSRLLANSHEWVNRFSCAAEDVGQGRIFDDVPLQKYFLRPVSRPCS